MYRRELLRPSLFNVLTVTVFMLLPIVADFAAMVQGSGERFPNGNPYGWFNGRYLIFVAPLFAFISVSLVIFDAKKIRKKMLTILAGKATAKKCGIKIEDGALILLIGIIPTFQPSHFGRTYAAYGGIFIISSIMWGMIVDKKKPDRFELLGSSIAVVGAVIIFYTPR